MTDLDDASKTNYTGHGCCDEICGGETTEKTEGLDCPWVQRPLPLALRVLLQGPPEGKELDGEDRVEDGPYEGGHQDHGPVPAGHDR